MPAPHRTIRAIAENQSKSPHDLSPRERDRHAAILDVAQASMAELGASEVTLAGLAFALHLTAAALRRQFADTASILAELLHRHLRSLTAALAAVPATSENPQAARRAAYLAATRSPLGGLLAPHLLLVRDRNTLPPDLLDDIEHVRASLGMALAGDRGHVALALLDSPYLGLPAIEAALAVTEAEFAAPLPGPQPGPQTGALPEPQAPEPREPNRVITLRDLAAWDPDNFAPRLAAREAMGPNAPPIDQFWDDPRPAAPNQTAPPGG